MKNAKGLVKKAVGRHATLSVIKNAEVSQTKGKLKMFDGEPAVVRVSMGSTLNMGNYQSLRLGVDLAMPCSPAEVDRAFENAAKFVAEKLDKLVMEHTPQSVGVKSLDEVEM